MKENISHDSAVTHVQGKSEFVDDRKLQIGELHVGLVLSRFAHAKIKSIDVNDAKNIHGVVGIYTARDLAHNIWGTIIKDQPVLASGTTQFNGEPIVVIAAENKDALEAAKKAVKIKYEELTPILSISEAKKKKSFIGSERYIKRGNVEDGFKNSSHRLSGKIVIRGQDHFYLESQACVAYPLENDCVEIHASSQHPTEVQHVVAHSLGVPDNKIVCVVKRMGGAFGGKESQASSFAVYAAMVAQKTKRPARLVLTKDDDMIITGKRNPFENEYEVGFDKYGKILALDVKLFSDGGAYADLSTSIMERAMLHVDNAYYIPNISISGVVCKTNHHPHTAFRGFGGPKGVATIENILEEIAHHLKIDPLDVRKVNVYGIDERNVTPYGQVLENNMLPKLFENIEQNSEYRTRRKDILKFNKSSKTHIRGMAVTAVKFGISFTTKFLNQGNAFVAVQMDGSVQVSTGATEMGQGVNTKIAQIVAGCFGLPLSQVRVLATSTERNHNTSPTAASSGTDINGKAALIAAQKIRDRLAQVAEFMLTNDKSQWASPTNAILGIVPELELPSKYSGKSTHFEDGYVFLAADRKNRIKFSDLCREAFLHRISLGEYGHFKIPGIYFDKLKGQGDPFFYFTQGTACSEVEIDRFTGETKVIRADILMDLGRPINEGIDIGQITGAFIQGMGWVTTENLYYDANGFLLSHSPSTYKIPNIQDIPRVFNVSLLPNDGNSKNISGSKAVGEPPLLLAISVWIAIKNALLGVKGNPINLSIPATIESVMHNLYEG